MEKVRAIVVRASDKKEKDKNILLFSIEKGKIWATLKGVKNSSAKMKIAQNPFCFGEFVLENGKIGQIVTGFESIETFHEISEDVDKYFEGTAILEILNAMEFETERDRKQIFVLAINALKTLCFDKVRGCYVLEKFMLEIFKISGFPLLTNKCSCCGATAFEKFYIDYSSGEIVCAGCKNFNSEELEKTTYLAMKFLSQTDFEKLRTLKFAEGSEIGLLKILTKNFSFRFDKNLKFIGLLS